MADLSDVMTALAQQCGTAIYPAGVPTNNVSPVNGVVTRLFPGWPSTTQIDSDLAAGNVTVSIYAGKVAKNTTRFMDGFQRVGTTTTLAREVRRVMREFQITVWAPDHIKRDSTAEAMDVALSSLRNLPLADGTQAYIRFARDWIDDVPQKELNYQRAIVYEIEFGTYQTETGTLVTQLNIDITGGFDPANVIETITYPRSSP